MPKSPNSRSTTPRVARRDFLRMTGGVLLSTSALLAAFSAETSPLRILLIRYRMPRLPRRPPRVWRPTNTVARGLSGRAVAAMRIRINEARKALTVSDTAARAQLRKSLSAPSKTFKNIKKSGEQWDAHHVIQWEHRKHPTLAKAADGGFNINRIENGIRIPQTLHKKVHSQMNNSSNRQAVKDLLNGLQKNRPNYTPAQTATVLRNHARQWKYDIMRADPLLERFNKEAARKATVKPISVSKGFPDAYPGLAK